MNENAFKNFNLKPEITAPAVADPRSFNEHDILGEFNSDEKGNLIIPPRNDQGRILDKQGRPANQKGYLINQDGDIIENIDSRIMFKASVLTDKGELPAPFFVEKFNFNPHEIIGDFDITKNKYKIL